MKILLLVVILLPFVCWLGALAFLIPRAIRLFRSQRRMDRAYLALVRADMDAISAASRGNLIGLECALEQRQAALREMSEA